MSYRAGLLACASVFLAGLTSCNRGPAPPAIERLAILRFENLSGDPSIDWMGRALAETIALQLSKSTELYVIPSARLHTLNQAMGIRPVAAPGASAESPLAVALNATRIGYGYYWVDGGRIHAHLSVEDLRSRRMIRSLDAPASPAPDIIPIANSLAQGISPQAQSLTVHNPEALRFFALAMESTDPAAMEREASAAIAADPDFAQPYLLLAEVRARVQNRRGAEDALQATIGRKGIDAADRAEIDAVAAGLRNDPDGRERALLQEVRMAPNNVSAWRSIAEIAANRHRFQDAGKAYARALQIEPDDVSTLNQAGYAEAWAGNLPAAMSLLRRYQSLRPNDANPLDSMGDVNLMSGRLAEAERFYLDALKKDPNFLNGADGLKAATARLMTGDVAGADTIFHQRYPQQSTDWLWITGRRKQAYAALRQQAEAAPKSPALAAVYCELALWSLAMNDRTAAAEMARKAGEFATPGSLQLALLVRFLSQPPAPAREWLNRAEQTFVNPAARDLASAYALLLAGEFAPAAEILRRVYDANPVPLDASIPIELGWALLENGNEKDAAPLLRFNPILGSAGPGTFTAFYFPRVFELRARLLEKSNPQEAAAARKVYEALTREQ